MTSMSSNQPYVDEMISARRRLHRHPEEGWTEFETTAFVAEQLRGWGYDVQLGTAVIAPEAVLGRNPALVEQGIARARANGVSEELLSEMGGYTGAMAVLDTGRPGPTTAFRFDMDCVLVEESHDAATHLPAKEGFASEYTGLMHACGHDAHTATGLGLAHWLMDHKDELTGRIKLLFQPAEEGTRGGAAMAAAGLVDDVDWFFGAHVGVSCKPGEVGVIRQGFLATTKIDIVFKGVPSHAGAEPEKGRSALLAAVNCAMTMQGIPRHSAGDSRVAIGTLHAGEGRNVTPVNAKMQIEVRGVNAEVNDYMVEQVDRAVKGASIMYGVEGQWIKAGEASNLVADEEACAVLEKAAQSMDGVTLKVFDKMNGSEDCTTLIRRAQAHGAKAGFFLYGCDYHGHHRADFEIQDTESLPLAFGMFTRVATALHHR